VYGLGADAASDAGSARSSPPRAAARSSLDRPPRRCAQLDAWAIDIPTPPPARPRGVAGPAHNDLAQGPRVAAATPVAPETVGVRVPPTASARALLARLSSVRCGRAERQPVRRGEPDTADHVVSDLGDASTTCSTAARAKSASNRRSSICRAVGVLLRPGGLAREAIEAIVGPLAAPDAAAPPRPARWPATTRRAPRSSPSPRRSPRRGRRAHRLAPVGPSSPCSHRRHASLLAAISATAITCPTISPAWHARVRGLAANLDAAASMW